MSENPTWPGVLNDLVAGKDLSREAATWAMEQILSDVATPAQVAGFAVALRAKGETQGELQGLVDSMYAHATTLDAGREVVDIVGTGGDLAKTVNISTMSSVVIAGAGIPVVKHGNRAASSASGSADVLEVMGIALDVPIDHVLDVLEEAGITFCFASMFHSSLKYTLQARRDLGIATVFNFLGPLANPARPRAQAIGSADARMAPIMAGVLAARGNSALVFRGDDGLDEITTTTTTRVWIAAGGEVRESSIDPRVFGFEYSTPEALRGKDPAFNAEVFRNVLAGEKGAPRDAVLLNAGAAIAAFTGLDGELDELLAAGVEKARASIDSGAAAAVIEKWSAATRRLSSRA